VFLVIFFLYFGLPSIQRFQAREVMVMTSKIATGGSPAPAITFMPRNRQTTFGWKSAYENATFPHYIQPICGNRKSGRTSIEGCINKNTYNQTEVFKDVLLGYTTRTSLLKRKDIWTHDFTVSYYGRAYTLNIEQNIGPDDSKYQVFVAVGYDIDYRIIIHDPLYFALNINPAAFPSITMIIRPNETRNFYYRLALTEVEEVNIPSDPCNPDRDYNFQACIKESLSRQVGCRTKWDRWSRLDLPLCTTMEQYRYIRLNINWLIPRCLVVIFWFLGLPVFFVGGIQSPLMRAKYRVVHSHFIEIKSKIQRKFCTNMPQSATTKNLWRLLLAKLTFLGVQLI
jgi:hypothetical protein